jgi:hypothetical protein
MPICFASGIVLKINVSALTECRAFLASGFMEAAISMLAELYPAPPSTPTALIGNRRVDTLPSDNLTERRDMLTSARADVDSVYGQICYVCMTLSIIIPAVCVNHNKLMGKEQTVEADELFAECTATCLNAGLAEKFAFRTLASFTSLPNPGDAHTDVAVPLGFLQSLLEIDGTAGLVLDRIAEFIPNGVQLMREHLLYAIEHGAKAPVNRNGWSMDVCAANILALLFGKEEAGDDHSLAVPSSVIATVRCACLEMGLHSRMPLIPTPASLKRACV